MASLMPKVFEEANLSGELRLSGRKLKDFPKTAAKYNLSDTVIAGRLQPNTTIFNFRHFIVGVWGFYKVLKVILCSSRKET